jgi:hypothetical protein
MTKLKYIFHKVVCDETNNTPKDIDNGIVNVDIYGEVITPKDVIVIEFVLENKDD